MASTRGFFAEMAHQVAVAEKSRQRAQAVAVREHARRQRETERTARETERIRQQAQRIGENNIWIAEKLRETELKQRHSLAQLKEVESRNGDLALQLADIDTVLSATLEVDDYVNLESLRKSVKHPPFESPYSHPIRSPSPIATPREPVFVEPEPPRGVGAVFGGKKKHAEAVSVAQARFAHAHQQWQQAAAVVPMQQLAQLSRHKEVEEARQANLAADRARYDEECAQREREAVESNASLDELIRDLDRGAPDAVEEYLGIVFSNSVYPSEWPWPPDYSYDADTKELSIQLEFPVPSDLPTVRQHKYVRARDEITTTEQTQKEQRERYAVLVNNMTLRTLHEVWEADRGAKIASISLIGSVSHVDLATGKDMTTPLVAVAVDRRRFEDIDLRRVAPVETMRHLGALVSKNPHALMPIKLSPGIRTH